MRSIRKRSRKMRRIRRRWWRRRRRRNYNHRYVIVIPVSPGVNSQIKIIFVWNVTSTVIEKSFDISCWLWQQYSRTNNTKKRFTIIQSGHTITIWYLNEHTVDACFPLDNDLWPSLWSRLVAVSSPATSIFWLTFLLAVFLYFYRNKNFRSSWFL